MARGVIAGLFQAAYVYTPEVYPTSLRSVGAGGCSALARLGAMATPYIAQVRILLFNGMRLSNDVGKILSIARCCCNRLFGVQYQFMVCSQYVLVSPAYYFHMKHAVLIWLRKLFILLI